MPMRSIEESLTQNPPAEGLPADANDLNSIAQSYVQEEHVKLTTEEVS